MKTKFNEFVNENKKLGNVFRDYKKFKPDYLSEKTYSFLINWTYNQKFLNYYKTNGVDSIDDDIVNELSKWKPKKTTYVYRINCNPKENSKFKNKLLSFSPTLESAVMLFQDSMCRENNGIIKSLKVEPKNILVDNTLFPNRYETELLDEVIVITDN